MLEKQGFGPVFLWLAVNNRDFQKAPPFFSQTVGFSSFSR
jgi:hypothetical protein